jgi:CRP-like cAMP-binding protein
MAKRTDMTAEYANILRQADIFYDLSESQLETVAELCSEITPKAGEIIFEESSASDELYVIAGGEVDIQVSLVPIRPARAKLAAPATLLTIVTLRRGQTFGEVALVDEGLRSASARCASKKARLLVIPRDRLIRLCDSHTNLGYRLMRNIAADLAFKIRGTDMAIRDELLWHPRPK